MKASNIIEEKISYSDFERNQYKGLSEVIVGEQSKRLYYKKAKRTEITLIIRDVKNIR